MIMLYDFEDALRDANTLMGSAIPVIHLSHSSVAKSLSPDKAVVIARHGGLYRNLQFATEALQSEQQKHDASSASKQNNTAPSTDQLECAKDMDEAKRLFLSLNMSFMIPGALLRNAADLINITTTSIPLEVAKQLKKDIERDKLMVNGQLFLGAEMGINKVHTLLVDVMAAALGDCQLPRQSSQMLEKLATIVLYRTSRTISGGMAVTALQSFVDMCEYLIVPDPQATPPLSISIHIGKPGHMLPWGIVCDISCEYVYALKSIEDCMGDSAESPNTSTSMSTQHLRLTYTHTALYALDLTEIEAVNWELITDDPSAHTFVRVERIV
ncbi:hypothetical protein EON63_19690 [archaeon]|nr:MAG: hypothetical protein EON63_19690 [archaeon]